MAGEGKGKERGKTGGSVRLSFSRVGVQHHPKDALIIRSSKTTHHIL